MKIINGDALNVLRGLPDESVQCCVTSPPYWGLRDYGGKPVEWPDGWVGSLGLEPTPDAFVAHLAAIFSEVRRVLRSDGTLWVNLGDTYNSSPSNQQGGNGAGFHGGSAAPWATVGRLKRDIEGLKTKDLIGIPWMVAFTLRGAGWYLRSDIIWHKPNPMPESVTDRPTKAHEYIFLLSKSERYYYDAEAIKEQASDPGRVNGRDGRFEDVAARPPGSPPRTLKRLDYSQMGRNKRTVWTVSTCATPEAHFATYPPDLIEPCILAGCPAGGTVLDPFSGAGTTMLACLKQGREFLGIELNPEYIEISEARARKYFPLLVGEL